MKTKLQSLGFTSGHVHLLLVAVAIFGILIVAKTDLNVKAIFAQADDQPAMLTFEEVQSQALATETITDPSDAATSEEDEKQMALLDRSLEDGAVLGEDIGIGTIPSAEDLYSPEQLNAIPLVGTVPTTAQSVQTYANQKLQVESYYDTTELFANLNSSDPALIKSSAAKTEDIIVYLQKIAVPTELVEYHKYKILYYQTLIAIGNTFVTQEGDLGNYTKTLFSLMNQLNSIEASVNNQYKITL